MTMSALWLAALADATARATVVLGIAAAITALPRQRSAALRHFVWALALAGALVLPLVGAVLPGLPVPMPWTAAREPTTVVDANRAGAAPHLGVQAPSVMQHSPGAAANTGENGAGSRATPRSGTALRPAVSGGDEIARPVPAAVQSSAAWRPLLLWIWGAGGAAFAAWSLAGIWNIRRLVAQATPVTASEWLGPLGDASARLGIRWPARLLQSDSVAMPMTWGWRRPVILVPAAAADWPLSRRTVVLRHELAHVRRGDVVTQLLAQWACAVYWFNPMVWLAAFRLRVERERACDDEVLRLGTRASDYANHLLDIARECQAPGLRASAAVAMARPSQLEHRLRAILDPTVRRAGRATATLATVVLTGAVLAVSVVTPTTGTLPGQTAADDPGPNPTVDIARPASNVESPGAAASALSSTSTSTGPAQTGPESEGWFADWHRAAEELFATVVWHLSEARRQLGSVTAGAPPVVGSNDAVAAPAQAGGQDDALDSRLAEAFIGALGDSDPDVRGRAARALGQHRVRAAAAALRTALGDEDPDVRGRAAWALGRIRDDTAVDSLLNLLRDPVQEVRERAAWALGTLRNPAAVDGLVAALEDADAAVQERIAWALGRIRDPRATQGLITALTVIAGDALHEVIEALARIGGEPAMEALIGLMDADDPGVRGAVIDALSRGNWMSTDESADMPVPPVPPVPVPPRG